MRWVRLVGYYVFTAGVLYLIFAYIGDFPARQSIVLAVVIAFLTRRLGQFARKPAQRFSPYYVTVRPNWPQLLTDFKLIDNREGWDVIEKSLEKLAPAEYSVVRDGLFFTTVQQSEDFQRTLIYWNSRRLFVSGVDLEEKVEPIKLERDKPVSRSRKYEVELFMRFGTRGYDLGIRVPEWWWNETKGSCPEPIIEDRHYPTGRVKLVLAIVPYREFDSYWEPVNRDTNDSTKWVQEINTRRDRERTKFDWTKVGHPDIPELSIDRPEYIEHKYFEVSHSAV
ncbi:MAG TPA: hypothetical protein VIW68_14815 [Candidatus Sulfotelmatobacter sp.]